MNSLVKVAFIRSFIRSFAKTYLVDLKVGMKLPDLPCCQVVFTLFSN